MTSVRIGIFAPSSTGDDRRPSGSIEWRPTRRRTVSGDVVLPAPFTVGLLNTAPVIEVAPTEATWVWRVVERVQGGAPDYRYLAVPNVGTVVDYADLVEVDPETLDPVAPLSPAWVSALAAGLAPKADTASLAPVATAGTYASLTGKPTIPAVPSDIGAQPAGSYATTVAGKVPDAQLPDRLQDPQLKAAFIAAGAVNPDDIGFDVVLLAGQSNEQGRGTGLDATYLDVADSRVWQYAQFGTYVGQVVAALDPLQHTGGPVASAIGHAMTFGRNYVRTLPPNRQLLLVPCAVGGSGFSTTTAASPPAGFTNPGYSPMGSWDPANGSGGTDLLGNAIAQANAALALNPLNRFAGVIWHQGESDVAIAATYQAKLDALIGRVRAEITGADNSWFLIGQMLKDYYSQYAGAQAINAAHIDTPRRIQRSGFFYGPSGTANQIGDNTHYNAVGQRTLGRAAFAALPRATANVTGTAPAVPLVPTLTQSGTSVAVAWPQQVGRVTDYNVQYSTDNGVTWTPLSRTQSIDVAATITGLTLGATVKVAVRAVNEQGTSGWSTVGTLALITLPGQASGLTAGTPTSTSVPLSWTAPSSGGTPTSYLVEYKLSASGTWLTGPTVTGLSSTVTGLVDTSAYNFRVTAQNAAGSGTASATANATTAAPQALLSAVGVTAYRAYGLRRLSPSATTAIQVRRSSDSTTTDVGFLANGTLDTATLLTFVGAGSGFISKWYDQSGSARDLTQATAAAQARIVNAGTLDADGGKPAAVFTASTWYGDATAGLYSAGTASALAVLHSTITSTQAVLSEATSAGTASNLYALLYLGASDQPGLLIKNSVGTQFTSGPVTTGPGTILTQLSVVDSATSFSTWYNGTVAINGTAYSRSGQTVTPTGFALGSFSTTAASTPFVGTMLEMVTFASALTSGQRASGEANQKAYYGTP